MQEGGTVHLVAVRAVDVGQGIDLAGQERGQMARDRRILGIGQAQLGERAPGAGLVCR